MPDDIEDGPLERIRKLVDVLSTDHVEHVWAGESIVAVERGALLTELRGGIHGEIGRTEPGRGQAAHERLGLNLQAFELYEDITGRIESFHKAVTGNRRRATPEETLRAWYVSYRAFFMSGHFQEGHARRVIRQLEGFVKRIRDHFDPPRVKELTGACPAEGCGLEVTKSASGATQSALYVAYRADERASVRCRACGSEWAGERTLLELGYYLRANVDEAALREMGVIV